MIRSHGLSILAIACCCSAAIASAFHAARSPGVQNRQDPAPMAPVFVAQHELLGVEVRGPAAADAAAAPVIATVADLLLDAHTGNLRSAVLALPKAAGADDAVAPRTVAIPWARLARDPATGSLTTALTTAELAALPPFAATAHGLRAMAAAEAAAAGKATPSDGASAKGAAGPVPAKGEAATLLASECSGLAVLGHGQRFGTCHELVVEQRSGAVAFAIVARAGEAGTERTWALPWAALVVQKAAAEVAAHLRADRTVQELNGAPELTEGIAMLGRQPFRQELYTFHRVATPAYDVRIDLKGAPTAGRDRR